MNEYINVTTPPTDFENSAYAVFWVERTDTTEIGASYNIPLTSSITASYTILPSNKMYGTFEMLAPPRIDEYLRPIQDTMIRSDRQTMNFGHNELSMGYNSSSNTISRTLMKWDLTAILPPRLIFTEAKLTLKFIDTYGDMNFFINKIESYWQEYTTTWKSQPIKGGLVGEYTVVDGQMAFEIDVIDLVKEWYENPLDNNGILLQSIDESLEISKRFGSKEMEGFEPTLHIQYIDPVIPIFERAILDSSIRIARHSEKELPSSIEINSIYQSSELSSSVRIHIPDTLESSIKIERNSINGSLTIWSNNHIPASINIPELYYTDLNANLNIAKLYLKSSIHIAQGNNLASSITINSTVPPSENIVGRIKIAVTSEKILNSSINIIRRIEEEDLRSSLNITRRVMPSKLTISGSKIIIGTIRIISYEQRDLPSNITISRSELPSSIKIVKNVDIPARVNISNNTWLRGTIFIPQYKQKDLNANLFILSNRFIPVKATIRSPYLRANITIARNEIEMLTGSIIVRDSYPYLDGEISIASPNSEDLVSQVTIKNASDFNERAYWFVV